MSIRMAIVDDHHLFLEGIVSILNSIEGIEVVISTTEGKALLTAIDKEPVDIVLLDLEMEPMDGLEVFKVLQEKHQNIKVIILSMHSENEIIAHLMKEGVNGYLLKETTAAEFEKCIKSVYQNGTYFNDTVSSAMLKSMQQTNRIKKPQIGNNIHLTTREVEVLELIAQEFTTQEIGEKLFLSPKTVEGHRQNLLSKFDVKNTAGLIMKAIANKLIKVELKP